MSIKYKSFSLSENSGYMKPVIRRVSRGLDLVKIPNAWKMTEQRWLPGKENDGGGAGGAGQRVRETEVQVLAVTAPPRISGLPTRPFPGALSWLRTGRARCSWLPLPPLLRCNAFGLARRRHPAWRKLAGVRPGTGRDSRLRETQQLS